MNRVTRCLATLALVLLLGVPAHAQKRPSKKTLGAPMYPKATFVHSFTEGPAARYLFASNDVTISVVRFYERKTGKQPERIESPDGMETYRFVLKGKRDATVPELEVQVSHFPGGFMIPDERGQTRQYSTTILVIKKRR
ncbi:MAG: hypothetical protein ACE5G5_00445 [Candidatus Methylomirabilales bacterium]